MPSPLAFPLEIVPYSQRIARLKNIYKKNENSPINNLNLTLFPLMPLTCHPTPSAYYLHVKMYLFHWNPKCLSFTTCKKCTFYHSNVESLQPSEKKSPITSPLTP
ncbi:hypothetical protein CEXT_348751 [Caerostris extrusa]|uniref:Uncharacterized protein n=1 Tax=Caerostris extrusa TaxID=172846 RepID=A0AAV4XST0_CAEEX|nr:hypothetical protein CEXT_348751 [Caerostris extrusa]